MSLPRWLYALIVAEVQDEAVTDSDEGTSATAQMCGGFALGIVFVLLGLLPGLLGGWTTTSVVLVIGGLILLLIQGTWTAVRRRRRVHQPAAGPQAGMTSTRSRHTPLP